MFRRRKAQLKEEHPATYPDLPFEVDESVEVRPVGFHNDGSICHPPQGFGSYVPEDERAFPIQTQEDARHALLVNALRSEQVWPYHVSNCPQS